MRGQMILEPKLPSKSIWGDSCGRGMHAALLGSVPSRSLFLSSLNLWRCSRAEFGSCTGSCSRSLTVAASRPLWIDMAVMVFLVSEGVCTMELGKASLRSSVWSENMGT